VFAISVSLSGFTGFFLKASPHKSWRLNIAPHGVSKTQTYTQPKN